MLVSRYEQLRSLLEELQGKEEWVVSVCVDSSSLVQHLETNEPQIQELDSLITKKTGGEAYLLRKKKGKITAALQQGLLQEIHEGCCQRLNEISADLIIESQCGSSTDGSMRLLSASVLSARGNFEVLERTAWEIENHCLHYSASVCLSGPWPAYSSVNRTLASE